MRRLILMLLALSACVVATPSPVPPFRNPAAPIYSVAALDVGRLAGNWVESAGFQPVAGNCRKGGGMRIKAGTIDYRLCIQGQMVKGKGPLRTIGPGRFALPGLAQPVWVLWVDGDYRTLVLGTPKGGFGVVLDRGRISPDRKLAVREILEWNGYDHDFYSEF